MKPVIINALLACALNVTALAAYDWVVARPARQVGVVDTLTVFRQEEVHLAALVAKQGAPEDRARIAERARAFAEQFPVALEQIAAGCGCVVVERSAIIGTPPHMVDLTPELKRRMRL